MVNNSSYIMNGCYKAEVYPTLVQFSWNDLSFYMPSEFLLVKATQFSTGWGTGIYCKMVTNVFYPTFYFNSLRPSDAYMRR